MPASDVAGRSSQAADQPLVSIIIPAFNAADTLEACLRSVAALDNPNCETIVVCDGCSDGTAQVARSFGVRVIENDSQEGAAYSRNVGAAAAAGDIFFFVDADCVLATDAVSIAVEALLGDENVVFGSYIAETSVPGFFTQFKNYQHHFTHQQAIGRPTSFWSGCGAINRSAFEDLKGFDVTLQACEDIEFGYALTRRGYEIRLLKSMRAEHLKRYNLRRWMRSDLFGRAVPWTRLAVSGRAALGKLNTIARGKASVAAVGLAGLFAVAAPFQPLAVVGTAVCCAFVLALNRGLLAFLMERRGLVFAAGGALALLVHFAICGIGYVLGRMAPRYPSERSPAPQYAWSEHSSGEAARSDVVAVKSL